MLKGGIMFTFTEDLEKIIDSELRIYEEIETIEEKKSDIIISKNGKELDKSIKAEENLLVELDKLENERQNKIADYYVKNNISVSKDVVLSEILSDNNSDSFKRIMSKAESLKKIIVRIKLIHENNEKLIKDNIEFFNLFISGLKDAASIKFGYNKNGYSNSVVSNSVFFNKAV